MKRLFLFLFALMLPSVATAARVRMSISFDYRGQRLTATFFSNVRERGESWWDANEFTRAADFLDALRFKNYTDRNRASADELQDLETGFFQHEPLRRHDEVLVLHRGEASLEQVHAGYPLGIGREILGLVAVDRLGDPGMQSFGQNSLSESLLLEQRLAPLGIQIPRPLASQWMGPGLPPGVSPHWDPALAPLFEPGRVFYGDVIQANALFAQEDLGPLLYSLANVHGLFSTGRVLPAGAALTQGGVQVNGPAVFVPTLVVWEVFNKTKDGVAKKGSRTRYYENVGAGPMWFGGRTEWNDPRMKYGSRVQVFSQTGDEVRQGWTAHFDKRENFSFVRDVKIHERRFETMTGEFLQQVPVAPRDSLVAHHPTHLNPCIDEILASQQRQVLQVHIPIQVSVSLGGIPGPSMNFQIRQSFSQ